jgi:predicted PurR-regulated permease PerM
MQKFFADIPTKTIVKFWGVLVLFFLGGLAIFHTLPAIIIIFLGIFFSIILNRPVDWFETKLKGRTRAILVVFLITLAIIALAIWLIIPRFVSQISLFIESLPSTVETLQKNNFLANILTQFGLSVEYHQLISSIKTALTQWVSGQAFGIIGLFGSVTQGLITVLTILMVTFFCLVEGDVWLERYWRIVYKNQQKMTDHQVIARKMYDAISGYVAGTIIIGLISAAVVGLGSFILSFFTAIPTEIFIPLSLIIFLSSFIPLFGGFIGSAIIELLIILYSFPAFLIFLVYLVITQIIISNAIVPNIFSKTINISPLTVLIAITFGTVAGGFLGVLIAIPLAGCIQVIVQSIINQKKYHGII